MEVKPVPAGVQYAADQLGEVTKAPVVAEIVADGSASPLAGKSSEAFAIVPEGGGYHVAARGTAGLMYGLLDLRDRLRAGDPPRRQYVSAPALRLRGQTLDFPFYLGVDLYNGRWRVNENIERSPDSWWMDKGHWAWYFRRCAEYRINALLLAHPHPFPALIDLPGGPEAAYFRPEVLKRLQDQFHWILDQAGQWGVKVYFLTWNIWTSPGFAKAHGINMEGTDSPLVRAYTRECYRRLFETYPKLTGVMTMAGEAPPGCVDFVRDAIVGGLNELRHPPELLFWTWCSYPEDAEKILKAYRGVGRPVHYLQYEQLFRPQADPRIRRTSEALGGVPVVTLGGLGTATGWLYWSDPYYVRDIMADLPRQRGEGCFFAGLDSFAWVAPKWLGWEALARYWWDPARPREDSYWRSRIDAHYGVAETKRAAGAGDAVEKPGGRGDSLEPSFADDFLQASIEASDVPTRMLDLLQRQTDHFEPQFGLPLIQYLGLPTLSTYVFENNTGIDAQGRLTPRLGLTWPNPDWGERIVGVLDYVHSGLSGTVPPQIADELQRDGEDVLARVARLRRYAGEVKGGAAAWNRCLDQMEMNAYLGLSVAHKIRAAIAWVRWCDGKADAAEVLGPLEQSAEAMGRMAGVAGRLYPKADIHAWRSCISRPLPWTNLEIWNTDRYRKFSFADGAAEARREVEWVREELAHHYSQPLLPFEDDLVAPPAKAKLLVRWNFDGAAPPGVKINNFPPDADAVVGEGAAPAPLVGRRLVATQHKNAFWFPLTTDPAKLPLRIGRTYRVSLDYWIDKGSEADGDWLSAGARTTEGGWQKDLGARYMGGKAGTRGHITLTFTPETWKDYYVYVSVHGRSKIELDNLEIWEGTGG